MIAARYVGGSALFHIALVLCMVLPHFFGTPAVGLGDTRLVVQSTSHAITLFEVADMSTGWVSADSSSALVEAIATPIIATEATEVVATLDVVPLISKPAKSRSTEHQKSTPHSVRPSTHSASTPTRSLGSTQGSTTVSQMARPDYAHNPKPDYPIALRDRGISGVVWFRVWVDAKGHPQEIEVAKGSGYRLFDEAALRAVQRWRFIPAKDAQQRLASWVEFAVRFVLSS